MIMHAAIRPGLAITGSVLMFALLIERAGLIPAIIATALVASLGSPGMTVREAVIGALCLAAAVALLFVGFLDQPFLLFPGH